MNAKFRCQNPGEMEFTMSFTMTMANWRRLRSQLDKSEDALQWPAVDLMRSIRELVASAEREFQVSTEDQSGVQS